MYFAFLQQLVKTLDGASAEITLCCGGWHIPYDEFTPYDLFAQMHPILMELYSPLVYFEIVV
jgi:hypothetical protein